MVIYPSKLNVPLLMIATGAMILSAAAQEAGQPIIFSFPKNEDPSAATPSLLPQNSQTPILPGTLMAPVSPVNFQPARNPLRPSPANSAEQQRLQAESRNWTLMTPAEIFGMSATEKLLEPPQRDAFGREKNPTQLERYLDRENQARTGNTNSLHSDRGNSPWSFSREEESANPFTRGLNGTADSTKNLNRFLDSQQGDNNPFSQNGKTGAGFFDTSEQQKAAKEKLEQAATMERFRQMLQPSSDPSPNSRFFATPEPVLDPNLTQPDFVPNPAGASFMPLSSSMGRPTGLTPLPGVLTPHLQPAASPGWKPQPPPWLSQGPAPTAFPQQKF
jgi:hypothetical protein